MSKYEQYRLQWMISHKHSISELVKQISEYQKEAKELDFDLTVEEAFKEWEQDVGFDGELWACEQEAHENGEC